LNSVQGLAPAGGAWRRITLAAAGLAASFFLGHASWPPLSDPAAARPLAGSSDGGSEARAKTGRLLLARPVRLAWTAGDAAPPSEPSDRRATATFMVSSLFRRLHLMGGASAGVPETSANALRPYLQGLADAVKQTSPAVRGALADEFTERLCGGTLDDAELITMAYLGLEIPDITSPRAFDCVFSRRGSQEDVVLWYMLDAWRHSGQDKSAAIAQIERTAVDPRTQRRLLSREAAASLRGETDREESE
jgi:hypothetical protein